MQMILLAAALPPAQQPPTPPPATKSENRLRVLQRHPALDYRTLSEQCGGTNLHEAAAALENNGLDARPYLGNGGYYTFAYFPPAGYNWQRIVVIGPEIDEDDDTSELPENAGNAILFRRLDGPAAVCQRQLDLTYTVHIDKSANITHEKLDDAIFKLTPNPSSGTISGGTWTIGDPQIVTTVDGAAPPPGRCTMK